jgi:hypothetical protein
VLEGSGIPLAVSLTAANVHDSMVFEDLIDGIGPIKRPRGRPRKRPEKLHADKAYDDKKCARALSFEKTKHQAPHSQEGCGELQEVGTAQMGRGADAGLDRQIPQAHYSLRAARRHP